ncbi:MAG: ABC transporter ATP-binding protein [Candidatus Helarchaeota archaeon]
MGRSVLKIEDLSFHYPSVKKPILTDINLEIRQGEFVLLVGKSGSGKSTFIKCFNGLIPRIFHGKFKGDVIINGKNTKDYDIWQLTEDIGLIFQNPESQLLTFLVEDELSFGPENLGIAREEINSRITWALNCTNMSKFRYSSLFELSDGQKQKIAIASSLTMKPEILVLDEPTSNLDHESSINLFQTLNDLNKIHNKTIFLVDHRTEQAIKYVNRVLILDSGTIVEDGNIELLHNKIILEKYGIRNPNFLKTWMNHPLEKEQKIQKHAIFIAKNIKYDYGKNKFCLNNLNFKIFSGKILAIFGHNGSGKTTLAKIIVGLFKIKTGSLFFDNIKVKKGAKLMNNIALILQNPNHQLFLNNVYQECAFSLNHSKIEPEEINKEVENILEKLNLLKLKFRHPHSLSEGEKQRTVIAANLIRKPKIIIYDEPTSGMDGLHLKIFINMIKNLQKSGITQIIITHDIELILQTAQHIFIMKNGQIIDEGKPELILKYIRN